MPPKRQTIGRSISQARKKKALRAAEIDEQREERLEAVRTQTAQTRSSQMNDLRGSRLEANRTYTCVVLVGFIRLSRLIMYGCSTALLRVWQCLFIAPVVRRRRKKSAGDHDDDATTAEDEYAFCGPWYVFNLCVMAACVAGGVCAVLNDARVAKAGGSLRMQNKSSAVVTVLQVSLQCMVCVFAVCRSAARHRVLCEIGRRLRAADAALRPGAAAAATAGRPPPRPDADARCWSLLLVALHSALYAVDCHSWYTISPISWMYFVCYAYLSIGLAAMLMYAQIAWNIGRRFEHVNAAIERKLQLARVARTGVRKDCGGAIATTSCFYGCPPRLRKFPVAPLSLAPGAVAYDGTVTHFNDISIAKLQELHWSLCNSIKMVNDNFGWQLFLQLFCNCVQLIVTPYLMIIDLFYPVIHNSTDLKFILIQVVWVFTHLSHLLLIVLPTSYATKKGEKTAVIICKHLTVYVEPNEMKQLEIFVLQLQKYTIDFSACGIVNLHRSTITTLIGTALTYLVILIQFHNSD